MTFQQNPPKKSLSHFQTFLKSGAPSIRPCWLLFCLLSILVTIALVLLRNHDAILIIGLHLNFKMGFITDLQQTCEQKGSSASIQRSKVQPSFPYSDNCDRSHLGEDTIVMPDPHASYKELEVEGADGLMNGGIYNPVDCKPNPKHKIAVIIPHRHREYHLRQLLHVLHPTLQNQKISYQVFVMHQAGEGVFNKARLLNAGVKEALNQDPTFDCFIMHDVDLVMENEKNLYYCNPNIARHISAGIDKYNYELPYDGLFGGVVALTKDQFERINGYSNEYWGWGCEDDDMFIRVVHSCVGLEHVMHEDARYKMIYHPHDQENAINSNRFAKLIHAADRQYKDGYNNIKYKVVSVEKKEKIYTNITIDVGTPEMEKLEKQQKLDAEKLRSGGGGELVENTENNNNKYESFSSEDNTNSENGEGQVDEEFEVSMQVICLTVAFIVYSLYKSRIVHYFFKQQNRSIERGKVGKSGRSRRLSKYEHVEDSSSETDTTEDNSDEKILLKNGARKKHHSRSQSVPFNALTLRENRENV